MVLHRPFEPAALTGKVGSESQGAKHSARVPDNNPCGKTLFENPSNQPHVTEWVYHGSLEHSLDRPSSNRLVRVLLHGAMIDSARAQGSPMHRNGVIHEQFNPHCRETRRCRTPCAMRRRLVGQVEIRSVNRKTGDDTTTTEMPKKFRAEGGLIELDCSISVTDSQHGRDLGHHGVAPSIYDIRRLLERLQRISPD